MQNRKKLITLTLLFAFLMLMIPTQAFGLEFIDVPITESYFKAVDKLSNAGVIQGRGDGAFAPKEKTTRAEFCAFLARANGYNSYYYEPTTLPFPDVSKGNWAYPYISFCYESGYINGMEDGTFRPDDYVTSEQAIKMVVCSSGIGTESLSKEGPKWYSGYLDAAQKNNLLVGANVQISNAADRAFVAQVVYNAMLVSEGTGTQTQDAVDIGVGGSRPLPVTENESEAVEEEPVEEEPAEEVEVEVEEAVEELPAVEVEEVVSQETEEALQSGAAQMPQTPYNPAEDGELIVVLDAGHNYDTTDTGAVGCGLREQDITYYIASKVKPLLEKNNITVIMTRNNLTDNVSTESVSKSLSLRCDIANEAGADVFVSIHCNAGGGYGTETYYYRNSSTGMFLADAIQKNLLDEVGLKDRGVKAGSFAVLRYTDMVAVLVETGFIDDEGDAEKLRDEECQWAFAEGIAKGICEYLGIEYQE